MTRSNSKKHHSTPKSLRGSPQDFFKIMQFSGNFKGKPPILSKFWAQGPLPLGSKLHWPPWPISWIRAWCHGVFCYTQRTRQRNTNQWILWNLVSHFFAHEMDDILLSWSTAELRIARSKCCCPCSLLSFGNFQLDTRKYYKTAMTVASAQKKELNCQQERNGKRQSKCIRKVRFSLEMRKCCDTTGLKIFIRNWSSDLSKHLHFPWKKLIFLWRHRVPNHTKYGYPNVCTNKSEKMATIEETSLRNDQVTCACLAALLRPAGNQAFTLSLVHLWTLDRSAAKRLEG